MLTLFGRYKLRENHSDCDLDNAVVSMLTNYAYFLVVSYITPIFYLEVKY